MSPVPYIQLLDWPAEPDDREAVLLLLRESTKQDAGQKRNILLIGEFCSFVETLTGELELAGANVCHLAPARPSDRDIHLAALLIAVASNASDYILKDVTGGTECRHSAGSPFDRHTGLVWSTLCRLNAAAEDAKLDVQAALLSALDSLVEAAEFGRAWLSAGLRNSIKRYAAALDLERALWKMPDNSTSGEIRSKSSFGTMKLQNLSPLILEFKKLESEVPDELRPALRNRIDFLEIGQTAARSASPVQWSTYLAAMFAWWAAHSRIRALMYAAAGDYASAASALVREIEYVLQCHLIETKVGQLTVNGEFLLDGRTVSGVSPLIGAAEAELRSGAGDSVVAGINALIGCRNKSHTGHGASGLNALIINQGVKDVAAAWLGLANIGSSCAKNLRGLLKSTGSRFIANPAQLLSRQTLSTESPSS